MAEISAGAVKSLRERTNLPLMQCKKALVEANGDEDAAIDILKKQVSGLKEKRAGNDTTEGRVFIDVAEDGSVGYLVEIQCESAPVAGGEDFLKYGNLLVKQLKEGPGADSVEALLSQDSVDGSGQKLSEIFDEMVNKIREKIVVAQAVKVDGPVGGYVHHDGKTGVLFQVDGDSSDTSILRDVGMHIAALSPTVCNIEDLDQAAIQAEVDRLTEEAKSTGKPENIISKIVEGRMNNFYTDQGVLSVQAFAKDDSKTVSQVLSENGFTAKSFIRAQIG